MGSREKIALLRGTLAGLVEVFKKFYPEGLKASIALIEEVLEDTK
jgi:hypothetical protein